MFTKIILLIIITIVVIGIYALLYEIKHAKEVSPKEPFLWDDYDEDKDETLGNG